MPEDVKVIKNLAGLSLLFIVFLLEGCVDYDEEMWLSPDLSGRLSFVLSVREELVRGQTGLERDLSEEGVRREVERIPGVKLVSFQSFRDSGKVIAKIALTFDSVEKLTRPETNVSSSTAVSFLGQINVREDGDHIIFKRSLPAIGVELGSLAFSSFPRPTFQGFQRATRESRGILAHSCTTLL
jgi:hypothetical protein